MNFRPESGYEVAVRVFRGLGVPIQDKNASESLKYGGTGKLSPEQRSQAMPSSLAAAEGTRLRTRPYSSQDVTYHTRPSDLGIIPNLERPSSGLHSYHGVSSSPSHEHLAPREDLHYNPTLADTYGLLPSPCSIERPTASYRYSLPSSSAPDKILDRPATAPISLSQLMPPRRELPFPKEPVKPISDRTPYAKDTSGPKNSDGIDPPNGASIIKARATGKAKGRSSRPSSSRAKPKPSAKKEALKDQPPLGEPGLQEEPQLSTTSKTNVPTSSSSKLSTSNCIMTEASPSKINTRSTSSAAVGRPIPIPEQFSKDFQNAAPEEYMSRLDQWVRKYQDLPAPEPIVKPTSTEKDQLAAYAAQTEEKRLEALDNMICDYLDDENFVQLVEDMDKSWRRIGLGF
ncbi:MAG: hypothetical protein Q9211_006342 [Gyalolechia sp. 1 TL-2023]